LMIFFDFHIVTKKCSHSNSELYKKPAVFIPQA